MQHAWFYRSTPSVATIEKEEGIFIRTQSHSSSWYHQQQFHQQRRHQQWLHPSRRPKRDM